MTTKRNTQRLSSYLNYITFFVSNGEPLRKTFGNRIQQYSFIRDITVGNIEGQRDREDLDEVI